MGSAFDCGRGNCREIWKETGFIFFRDLVEDRMTKELLKLRREIGRGEEGLAEWIFSKPCRSLIGACQKGRLKIRNVLANMDTAAETDTGHCICGKPFPIENTVRDPLKISTWVGEEGCREKVGVIDM